MCVCVSQSNPRLEHRMLRHAHDICILHTCIHMYVCVHKWWFRVENGDRYNPACCLYLPTYVHTSKYVIEEEEEEEEEEEYEANVK